MSPHVIISLTICTQSFNIIGGSIDVKVACTMLPLLKRKLQMPVLKVVYEHYVP